MAKIYVGDMTKSVYDTKLKNTDVFDYIDKCVKDTLDEFTFDDEPRSDSDNPVKSRGIYSAIEAVSKNAATYFHTVTLTADGWVDGLQTVPVPNISDDETLQLIQPIPSIAGQSDYYDSGVKGIAQDNGELTFSASEIPEQDLTVYIVIKDITGV